jgi:hypothetical protein
MPRARQSQQSEQDDQSKVELAVTRTVVIHAPSGRPAVELEAVGDRVKVTALPRNSGLRERVTTKALREALCALHPEDPRGPRNG